LTKLPKALSVLSIASGLGAWEALSRAELLSPVLFPPPSEVFAHLFALTASGLLLQNLAVTFGRVLAGFLLGAGLGTGLGLLCGARPSADALVDPWVRVIFPVPKVALLPLLMLLLGVGESLCLVMVALSVALQIFIVIRSSVAQIDRALVDAARNLGAGRSQLVRDVVLPSIFPYLIVGTQLGLLNAIRQTILVEGLFSINGLGFMLWKSGAALEMKSYYAHIVALSLFGVLSTTLLRRLLHDAAPWFSKDVTGR